VLTQDFDGSSRDQKQFSPSDLAWTRSDALNRMLADLYEIASRRDENSCLTVPRQQRPAGETQSREQGQTLESRPPGPGRLTGVYVISVAARLVDMHPQTLRKYDKEGLVRPQRSQGSRRLYSDSDVERLRVIRRLADELGLNLNGVSLVLDLVRSLTDIVSLLESSPEVSDTDAARVAADELRQILSYVGAD
jgi:DNA-binding transcriptional MerR regulator